MSDIIGVLGEASQLAIGTYTVYTCPAGKAAKGKLMYRAQAGAGGASTLAAAMNGITIFTKGATTASHYIFSSVARVMNTGAAAPTGADSSTTVGSAPEEYYLSAGDLVQYVVGGEALIAANFQFVGAEVDVS